MLLGLIVGGTLAVWATGGGSGTCPITDETAAFAMLTIRPATGGGMMLTWESCTDHVYEVRAAATVGGTLTGDLLTTVVGTAGSTSWIDTQAAAFPRRFYRVRRQYSSEDADGDGIPNGWELQYGLNPLDPGDAHTVQNADGVDNLTCYQQGRDPTKGAVPDTSGQVNLSVFTVLE